MVFVSFESIQQKDPPKCHDSMSSLFSRMATTLCGIVDPVCIRKLYERGQDVGVVIVM